MTGTVQTLQAVVESEGLVVRVTDAELETARILLGESEGVWSELGGGGGWRPLRSSRRAGTSPPARASWPSSPSMAWWTRSHACRAPLQTVDARVDELLRVLAVRGE